MIEQHLTLQYQNFEAKFILTGEWSLYELAGFLIKTIGFDFDHAFQFCDNLTNPYRSKVRYSLFADMGEADDHPDGSQDGSVRNTSVSAVFTQKRKMLFHFDFGDDWFFIVTCTVVKESTAKKRSKKVVSISGTPPVQYPDFD